MNMADERKTLLSPEFMIATEIFGLIEREEKVWYNKLCERLQGKLSRGTISKALNSLFDWGIVKAEYGETTPGHAGRLLFISNESEQVIRVLYERYWKEEMK